MIVVELQREDPWPVHDWDALAARAAAAALSRTPQAAFVTGAASIEISVRLTTDAEVRALNARYRQKDRATNVLSFAMVQPDLLDTVGRNGDDGEVLLGDIVLAFETCAREAAAGDVALHDHATHLIMHGTLHLLGYDHMVGAEAEAMEAIERDALAALGIADPYPIEED